MHTNGCHSSLESNILLRIQINYFTRDLWTSYSELLNGEKHEQSLFEMLPPPLFHYPELI